MGSSNSDNQLAVLGVWQEDMRKERHVWFFLDSKKKCEALIQARCCNLKETSVRKSGQISTD